MFRKGEAEEAQMSQRNFLWKRKWKSRDSEVVSSCFVYRSENETFPPVFLALVISHFGIDFYFKRKLVRFRYRKKHLQISKREKPYSEQTSRFMLRIYYTLELVIKGTLNTRISLTRKSLLRSDLENEFSKERKGKRRNRSRRETRAELSKHETSSR